MFDKKDKAKPSLAISILESVKKPSSKPMVEDSDSESDDLETEPSDKEDSGSDDKKLTMLADSIVDAVSSGDVPELKSALKAFVASCMKNY